MTKTEFAATFKTFIKTQIVSGHAAYTFSSKSDAVEFAACTNLTTSTSQNAEGYHVFKLI